MTLAPLGARNMAELNHLGSIEHPELPAPHDHELLQASDTETTSDKESESAKLAALAQSAREAVDRHVTASEEIRLTHPEQDTDRTDLQLTRELKDSKYEQVLIQTQAQLQGPSNAFSKVIHKPVIERISSATAETIARPSGLLGGSIGALLGSLLVLFSAKHYGFAYNFLLFVFIFGVGFIVGLATEGLMNLLRHRR